MKYCHRCHKFTLGEPLYCTFCGSTYDVKLCSRLHPNPRYAEVCSQCGSREMSAPQPKLPLLARPVILLVQLAPKLLSFALIAGATVLFFHWLFTDPIGQRFLLCLVVLTGLLLFAWSVLPPTLQRFLRRIGRFSKNMFFPPRKDERRRT